MKLGPFVPEVVRRYDREKPWSEWIEGSVLFADVSGFTRMSEELATLGAEGAEVLTDILNRYFAEMIQIVHSDGGQVMKFGGDAILCFFEGAGTLDTAIRCAFRMHDSMPRFRKMRTPVRTFSLQMKIGIAAGSVLLAGLGDPGIRCDYGFAGDAVDMASEAEHHAAPGEVILAGPLPASLHTESITAGIHRVLKPPDAAAAARIRATEDKDASTVIRPYMIREVYEMVEAGYRNLAGSLTGAVIVFLKFDGFHYDRKHLDLVRLNNFVTQVLALTQEHSGRLNRVSMGDKGSTMLVLFGTPAALEKKEPIACQWAVEVRALASASFPDLDVRMGMTSGRVFSGIVGGADRLDFTVMGDSVNLAARLMQEAGPGEICVADQLREKAWELFEFASLGERKIKGKSEPVEVFALSGRRTSARTLQSAVVYGRTNEATMIADALESARAGDPCMIVLEGEPGVGKSSLAAQALKLASQDWKIFSGKGDVTRRGFAYNPLRDPVVSVLFPETNPDIVSLSALLREHGFEDFLEWHADFLGIEDSRNEPASTPAYDEETRRSMLHHQLSVILLDAIRTPTILFLDDLHWFKTSQLDFIAAILSHLEKEPLAILATARPDWARESFVNRSACKFIPLQTLDREAIRELAENLLDAPVRDNVVDYLEKQARGNPFFAKQLLTHLTRNQLVAQRLGEWTLSREGALDRSLSGEDIVVTQVEQLSLAEKMHLRAAACIGPTLSTNVLQKALGNKYRARVVHSLRERGFLQSSIDSRLAFPHALFQEALYHSLPKRLRRQYHRRIGFALEELHGGEKDKYLPTLAYHFYEGGVRTKAIDYSIAAGNEYHTRRSFPEALPLLEKAYALMKRNSDSRKWDTGLRIADERIHSGRIKEAVSFLHRFAANARKANISAFYKSRLILFDALCRLSDFSFVQAAEKILADPNIAQFVSSHRILYYIALANFRKSHLEQAMEAFERILSETTEPDPTVFSSFMMLASIHKIRGDHSAALQLLQQALQLDASKKSIYLRMGLLHERANVLMESGKLKDAEAQFRDLLIKTEELGDFQLTGVILNNLANIRMDLEDYEPAEALLKESVSIFSRIGAISFYGKSLMDMGALAFYKEDFEKALQYYLQSVNIFESTGEMQHGSHAYYNIAEALSMLNRNKEALDWLDKGDRVLDRKSDPRLAKLYEDLHSQLKQ